MFFVDKKQFIRFKYLHDQPSLIVFDHGSDQYEYISIEHQISLKKSTKKYCIGSYDLTSRKIQPCEQQVDLSGTKYVRCRDCESMTGFMECVKCNGLTCRTQSEQAIAYCN